MTKKGVMIREDYKIEELEIEQLWKLLNGIKQHIKQVSLISLVTPDKSGLIEAVTYLATQTRLDSELKKRLGVDTIPDNELVESIVN
jgi:hypothetical protein